MSFISIIFLIFTIINKIILEKKLSIESTEGVSTIFIASDLGLNQKLYTITGIFAVSTIILFVIFKFICKKSVKR